MKVVKLFELNKKQLILISFANISKIVGQPLEKVYEKFNFMQAFKLSFVDLERWLDSMLFICSHEYVDPNIVSTAVLMRRSVEKFRGSSFQVFNMRLSSRSRFPMSFHFCSFAICSRSQMMLAWYAE